MKQFFLFVFLCIGGLFCVNAQDMIVLRDGNIIEAKVMEIHPMEIRYKRFDNLDGPMIVIPKDSVLSIKYENGVLDIINASPATGQESDQTDEAGSYDGQRSGIPTSLQIILNALPAIPIAGNNLKFLFDGNTWTATVNGENFSTGTIEREDTDNGAILTLKQTHIWPGAIGKAAGRIASKIPGGAVVGNVLDTAGSIAGAVGAIEASGPEIVLEYKAGPPPKLTFLRSAGAAGAEEAKNKFDLDGYNAFAVGITALPTWWLGIGGGINITLFEKYKPNVFFTPSYFLTGKYIHFEKNDIHGNIFALGAGVLLKHRFPSNRVLWNFGTSLEFMWVDGKLNQEYVEWNTGYYGNTSSIWYTGESFLIGMDIRTGFSFRLGRHFSLDLNGVVKFPFDTLVLERNYEWDGGGYPNNTGSDLPENKSYWPLAGGVELGFTLLFPYRSREQ